LGDNVPKPANIYGGKTKKTSKAVAKRKTKASKKAAVKKRASRTKRS
jgi:hypothetical protein